MTRKDRLAKVVVNTQAVNKIKAKFRIHGDLQRFIDMSIVRLADPYVPSDTTAIRKSVFLNTDFGSGRLIYTIYGKRNGRNSWNDTVSDFQDRPQRGPYWVIRMLISGGKNKLLKGIHNFINRG